MSFEGRIQLICRVVRGKCKALISLDEALLGLPPPP
jgi:hypothetical protein